MTRAELRAAWLRSRFAGRRWAARVYPRRRWVGEVMVRGDLLLVLECGHRRRVAYDRNGMPRRETYACMSCAPVVTP